MKKTLFLTVIFALVAGALFAQTVNVESFSLRLPPDGREFKNIVKEVDFLQGGRFLKGEVYTLKTKFTVSRDLESLWWCIVDNSAGAPGWWQEMFTGGDDGRWMGDLKAGTVYEIDLTFTVENSASSNSREANAMMFVAKGGRGTPTINFTDFSFTKH